MYNLFYSWLNVKGLLAWNRCDIWSLSDSNGIRTHSQLLRKRTLNHYLARWLSVRLRTKWLWVRIPLLSIYCTFKFSSKFICFMNKTDNFFFIHYRYPLNVSRLSFAITTNFSVYNWMKKASLFVKILNSTWT